MTRQSLESEVNAILTRLVGMAMDESDDFGLVKTNQDQAKTVLLKTVDRYVEERVVDEFNKGEKYGRLNEHHVIGHDIFSNADLAALEPNTIKRLKRRQKELGEKE